MKISVIVPCYNEEKTVNLFYEEMANFEEAIDPDEVIDDRPKNFDEKVLKNERPIVKRFVSQAYDGEYGDLPLKIAGIVTEYIEENV